MKQRLGIYFGEFFGTFLLVFFGISAVAVSVLFDAISGIVQISMSWPADSNRNQPGQRFRAAVAYFAGWNKVAIPGPQNGFFSLYTGSLDDCQKPGTGLQL